MHGQEFATAVQYDLPVIVVIPQQWHLRTIRMHQNGNIPAAFPHQPEELRTSPFARLRRLCGETVETITLSASAFERAPAAASRRSSRSGSILKRSRPRTRATSVRSGSRSPAGRQNESRRPVYREIVEPRRSFTGAYRNYISARPALVVEVAFAGAWAETLPGNR